jgi:hemolysin activation/secretion protein
MPTFRSFRLALILTASAVSWDAALAQAPQPAGPTPSDGAAYPISELVIEYVDPNPQFPPPEEMAQLEVEFTALADGLVGPRADVEPLRIRIADLPQRGVQQIYASALRALNQQLVFEFNRRDFHAIVVAPSPEDIERRSGRDLRAPGNTKLRLSVYAGRVKDLRTFASGAEFETAEEKVDRAEHAWIREGSPIQPGTERDLVRKDQLDVYLARVNRHPSRRVDAEISPARTAGGVNLDFMVAENKPWWAYFQLENTGTEETTELRERFGFVHSSLLGRDDVLQLDYITGNFDEVHAALLSYEAPWKRAGWLRGRVFANYSQYDASVLGFPDVFHGDQATGGVQAIATVFQHEELFLDAVVGVQWDHIQVENDLAGSTVDEDFFLSVTGLRFERNVPTWSTRGEISFLHNFDGVAGTDPANLLFLGRFGTTDADFSLIRWNLEASFFVEPLISPLSWRDPSVFTTRSLAHEVVLATKGQNSLGNRLIPQQEQVAGGLYSVRGYSEAAAVGDDVESASIEYRLHVPRLLKPGGKPLRLPVVGEFRTRPQYDYTVADWDLALKMFVDYAHVGYTRPDVFEEPKHLLGAGAGMELRFERFLTARLEYGVVLREIDLSLTEQEKKGDGELHFSFTFLY